MSNIEKIKAEIKRLKNIAENDNASEYLRGQARVCRVILSFIDSLPEEKPSEDLEEAAEEYTQKMLESWRFDSTGCRPPRESFIAGAEWQARQLLKGSPLPEDTVLFNKGVEEGKRLMMEEAVEGEIGYWNQRGLSIRLDKSLERLGYDMDTKVRIVIVKKKEEET